MIDHLRENGASLSAPDSQKTHPIHYVAQMFGENEDPKRTLAVLDKLISLGVDANCLDGYQRTPLLWAASAGSFVKSDIREPPCYGRPKQVRLLSRISENPLVVGGQCRFVCGLDSVDKTDGWLCGVVLWWFLREIQVEQR